MAERLSIEHYVGECALKYLQVVLAARVPRQDGPRAPSDKRSGRWFLLDVEDVPGLPTQVEPWRRNLSQPLVLEVFATGSAGGDKLLERWTLHYSPSGQSGGTGSVSRAGTSDDAAVYKRMILLVRSLHSYVRVLPTYRLFRAVKRQPSQPLRLAYRLTSLAPDGTSTVLGSSTPGAMPLPTQGGLRGAFAFSPVETPGGFALRVGVDYAPAGVAHMLLEATAAPAPASSAPRIIPDYVGGSGAPGERASVAAMAGGGSASGSPACAHSAPGGRLLGSGGGPLPTGPLAGGSPLVGGTTPLLVGSAGGLGSAAFAGSPLQLPRAASLRPVPVVRQSWGSREVPAHVVHRGFSTAPGTAPASPASGHRRSSSGSGPALPPQPWGPGSAGAGASTQLGTSPAASLHQAASHGAAGRPPLPVPHSPGAVGAVGPASASPTTPLSLPRPSPLQRSSSGVGQTMFASSSPPTPQHTVRGGISAPAHAGLPPSGQRGPHMASPHQSPGGLQGRPRQGHALPRPLPGPAPPRPPAAPAAIMQGFEPRPTTAQPLEQQQQQQQKAEEIHSLPSTCQEGASVAGVGDDSTTSGANQRLGSSADSASGLNPSEECTCDSTDATAPQHGTPSSAPVSIPGRGSRGRARSVTDLSALGAAASSGAGGLTHAMGRAATGAGAAADGTGVGAVIGAASTTSADGAGPAAGGLLHRAGPGGGHLAMAPSSAPAAPRGMLGQLLLAQGASSPQGVGCALALGALPPGSLLGNTHAQGGGSTSVVISTANDEGGSSRPTRDDEEPVGVSGALACPTAAVIVRPHAGPPFHRLSQVTAASSRSPSGVPHPQPLGTQQPRRMRSGECGGSGEGSPMAVGPLSASPSLPFAFTPSGASVRSLVEQHRWGGGGGGMGPTPLPHVSLAAPLPGGLSGPSQLQLPLQLPSPSPPVSGRDITALATIRRPSWSGRSVTLCAPPAVAVSGAASGSPSPRGVGGAGDSGGGSGSLHLAAGLSVSPGGGEDLLADALASDGSGIAARAPTTTAVAAESSGPGACGSEMGGNTDGSQLAPPAQASQGGGTAYLGGPEESEGDALPFALDSDMPLAFCGQPLTATAAAHGAGGSQAAPVGAAGLGSSPSRVRDLGVCAFIRSMQDAPPLSSHWGWGGGAATVGDALLQVEQLAARLQPVLLQPPTQ